MVAPRLAQVTKKNEPASVYVTGFCLVGAHEAAIVKSASGVVMKSCPMGGRFDAGRVGEILCTCECHQPTRELEDMTKVQMPATIINRTVPALARVLGAVPGTTGTGGAPGSGDPSRPVVAVASGATFVATPSGRAARGQLTEEVRHAISAQVKAAGAEMISMLGLTPATIGAIIDKASPPSSGAIYSVLKKWESAALVVLAESPFRFVKFTELGDRELKR